MLLLALACGPGVSPDVAKNFVAEQAATNPKGRLGVELLGRSTWSEAPMFDPSCVANKNLAYPDDPRDRPATKKSVQRISPTFEAQRWITAATDSGWCVLLGEGLEVSVSDPAVGQLDSGEKAWMVPVSFTMSEPSPWWECLDNEYINRTLAVVTDPMGDKTLHRGSPLLTDGACPHPMPGGEERKADARPRSKPKKAPTKDQVVRLMERFDDALEADDYLAALDMVSCYNLFEESTYGTCSPAEIIQLAPHVGEGIGMPWTEYVIADLGDIDRITPDREIETMYHVRMRHKRNGRERSMGVEWADGEWKLVGVLGAKGADLSTLRFIYDLHKTEKRDIFLRRLDGEEIDEKGYLLDPFAEEEEEDDKKK